MKVDFRDNFWGTHCYDLNSSNTPHAVEYCINNFMECEIYKKRNMGNPESI